MTANLPQTKTLTAFTLVELLVVVSISAIFLTLGFSAYRKTQERQTLHNAAKKTETILRSIQKKAVVGDRDCDGTFHHYDVKILANNNQITSQAICKNSNGIIKTFTIPGIIFTNGCDLIFKPLHGGFNLVNPQQTSFDIQLTLQENQNLTATIHLAQPGTIVTNL